MISGSQGSASAPARLVLVGVRGFGEVHAARIARLTDEGLVELVAAVDPGVTLDPPVIYGTDLYPDLDTALAAVGPVDVVVVAAPLGALPLAHTALTAGADVYLEKPPVTSLDDFTRLLDLERETGRVVQVGFQSLGSHALQMLQDDTFGIGRWSGSVPSGPGRGPWATGPAHRGRPPQPARPAGDRRGAHQRAGARGGHGSGRRRLPHPRGRRGGRDRPVPGQRHRLRRHLGGPSADRRGPRRDLRPHPVRTGPARP